MEKIDSENLLDLKVKILKILSKTETSKFKFQ